MIGKNDISAMKMSATGTRGYEARDFVDIYYLLKEIEMKKIIENFRMLYKTEDIAHYKRSMTYFDDVSEASWKSLKMIRDNIVVDDIKNKLIEEVAKYDRKILMNL